MKNEKELRQKKTGIPRVNVCKGGERHPGEERAGKRQDVKPERQGLALEGPQIPWGMESEAYRQNSD